MLAGLLFGAVGSGLFYWSPVSPLAATSQYFLEVLKEQLGWHVEAPGYLSSLLNSVPWRYAGTILAIVGMAMLFRHCLRVSRLEDEALRGRFDGQWKLYNWNVPRRFFPGVL